MPERHSRLESARLLADARTAFNTHCTRGLEPNRARIVAHLSYNLPADGSD